MSQTMSLSEKITHDLKTALKARDTALVSALRMLKSSLKNAEVEKMRPLEDEEILSLISSLIRKGKEAAAEFQKGGRDDLARKEEREIDIYYQYLPKQRSSQEIKETLIQIIGELGAKGPKDLGTVMKAAMVRLAGQAEGKTVNELARELLGSQAR